MKLTIKSLKQVVYPIEVESDEIEVLELKKKIEETHQFDHKTVNLVFNGSKLVDTKKLSEYNIKDENVIIMMSSKVKPVNVNTNPPEESKKEEKVESDANANKKPQDANANQNVQQPQAQPKPKKDYSNESKMLQDMGFAKEEADAAINAAKGNVSLAIEFLSNGHIPEELLNEGGDEEMEGEEGSASSALRNIASLFKVLCQGDPTKFQGLLMNLQQQSPEIVEMIQEHETEFKELIQAPITEEDIRNFQTFNQSAGGMMGQQGGQMGHAHGQQPRGGDNVIRLTKEEFESVNRLKELGFNEREAAQAFLACDKNEEYAANFLMENKIREQEEEMNIDCKDYFYFYFNFVFDKNLFNSFIDSNFGNHNANANQNSNPNPNPDPNPNQGNKNNSNNKNNEGNGNNGGNQDQGENK